MKANIKKNLFWVVLFIFIMVLTYMLPLTGDDWGKGAANLIGSLKDGMTLWTNYNGRVLGNALVSLLKYNIYFKCFFTGFILSGIIYFTSKVNNKNKENVLITILLFLLMPLGIFREGIAWMSGFANFTVPAFCITIIIYKIRNLFTNHELKYSIFDNILFFVLGLFMNLFAEHSAIFSVIFSFGINIVAYILNRKIYKGYIILLLGSIIGCGLMFASPSYWNGLPRLVNAAYFNEFNILQKIYYNIRTSSFMNNLFYDNLAINIITTILFLLKFSKYKNIISKISVGILLIIAFILNPIIIYFNLPILSNFIIKFLIIAVFYIAILYLLFYLFYKENKRLFYKLACLLISIPLVAAPLLASYQFGPRCFLNNYVIYVLFTISLYNGLSIKLKKWAFYPISIISVILFSLLSYKIVMNYKTLLIREEILTEAKENNYIYVHIPIYPYPELIHMGGELSKGSYHYKVFLLYYDLKETSILEYYQGKDDSKSKDDYSGFIDIQSYDGFGQVTHPSVLYFLEKVNNYHYWMAYTPWPYNQNKYENPSIAASNDGINWETPEGLVNPVSGIPSYIYDYYSDPCLIYTGEEFELWYRYNPYKYKGETSNQNNNLILRKISKDGVNWSDAQIIFDDEKGQAYMSISVVKIRNKYQVWYVNYDAIVYYRYSEDLKNWSEPKKIEIENFKDLIWHGEIKLNNNLYEGLFLNSKNGELFYTSSVDGENFREIKTINNDFLNEFDNKYRVYKSSMIKVNNQIKLFIPYNNLDNNSSVWSLYLKNYDITKFYNE